MGRLYADAKDAEQIVKVAAQSWSKPSDRQHIARQINVYSRVSTRVIVDILDRATRVNLIEANDGLMIRLECKYQQARGGVIMNDWISRSQADSRREIKKKSAIEDRFHHKVAREIAKRQKSYEINQMRIEGVYHQIETHVQRAREAHFQVGLKHAHLKDTSSSNPAKILTIEGSGSINLTPDGNGFEVSFFSITNSGQMYVHRHFPITIISERRILSWIKWVATGKGSPWGFWARIFS